MATKKKKKTVEKVAETEEIEKTIDPYTGELEPVAEDADQFIEVIPEETDDREGSNYLLKEETSMDSYAADADADAVAEQIAGVAKLRVNKVFDMRLIIREQLFVKLSAVERKYK